MKISIVIPAHNEEASLPETLRAALAQDHPDYEVIVVDNASTDRTYEVASGFPIIVVRESRKGLLWARECGRLEAKGEIIANMDADCLPEKDWLSRGSKHFSDEKVSAVTGPYDYYDADPIFRGISLFMQKYVYRPVNIVFQLPAVRAGAILIGGNNLIRKSAIEKAGGYNTDLAFYGEDTDTAKRVSAHGTVIFDNRLTMKTSARRFKSEGVLNITGKYIYHFFKTIFSKGKKKGS